MKAVWCGRKLQNKLLNEACCEIVLSGRKLLALSGAFSRISQPSSSDSLLGRRHEVNSELHNLSCVSISWFCLMDKREVESWGGMSYGSLRLLGRWSTSLTPFEALEDTVVPSRAHVGPAEQDIRWQNTWTKVQNVQLMTRLWQNDHMHQETAQLALNLQRPVLLWHRMTKRK